MSERMIPTRLHLHQQSGSLELQYSEAETYQLSSEYLRVHSPSAEVRGHGVGNETLQTGKRNVRIKAIEPVGNYALKFVFDDGHDSGLYDWATLYDLARNEATRWQAYLDKLTAAGASRDKR